MTKFAQLERAALADLMAVVGPDAPTLCEGWTTRDLAAHLIVRGSRPDAAAGIVIKQLAEHASRVQAGVARRDWDRLVADVRRRPWWAVVGEEAVNRFEYFIHHEDVRRAQPDWQPREVSHEFATSMWARVRTLTRFVLRKVPAEVSVTAPGFGTAKGGRGRGKSGPAVTLVGPPAELLLFLSGRQAHAHVELSGPDKITDRMRRSRYGV